MWTRTVSIPSRRIKPSDPPNPHCATCLVSVSESRIGSVADRKWSPVPERQPAAAPCRSDRGHKLRLQQPHAQLPGPTRPPPDKPLPHPTRTGEEGDGVVFFGRTGAKAPPARLRKARPLCVCEQTTAFAEADVDHEWPAEDREPDTYDHPRIEIGGRSRYHARKPAFCNGSRDPRFACPRPVSWADAVSGNASGALRAN